MINYNYTALIKEKGWKVKDALAYWGRGQDWYIENRKGDEFAQRRLRCLIDGLEGKPDFAQVMDDISIAVGIDITGHGRSIADIKEGAE